MSRWWYLAVFPLLWVSALGFLQARQRTCVAFAARGVCELDDGRRIGAGPGRGRHTQEARASDHVAVGGGRRAATVVAVLLA